jgi:ribulose-5-phosphate 4-epimerase/fuculose-1-phosphate aldolase
MNPQFRDDGIVKFQAIHQSGPIPDNALLKQLDDVRTRLFDLGLVGTYEDGVSYGNVSFRHESGCIISGTSTGVDRVLGSEQYCYVQSFDLQKNIVYTKGPIQASSESMTHCAAYYANAMIHSVLHIHHRNLWQWLINQNHASTPANVAYGTPEMAFSIANIVQQNNLLHGAIVMAGHEEGIITYGETIHIAFNEIEKILSKSLK